MTTSDPQAANGHSTYQCSECGVPLMRRDVCTDSDGEVYCPYCYADEIEQRGNTRVLIACEFSGVVREAFRSRGYDAWSCDILPPDDNTRYHIHDDVRNHIGKEAGWKWDLMIAHPPCTYLANSGVRWLSKTAEDGTKEWDYDRWNDMEAGATFFRELLDAPITYIAVENPIPHGYAVDIIGRKYDQIVQPWMFGHGETKATCLWLKNLSNLRPTNVVDGREGRVWKESPGPDRWKRRSITYPGLGEAMAMQWGKEVR